MERIKTVFTFAAVVMIILTTSVHADLVAYWPLNDGPEGAVVTVADDKIDAGLTFTDAVAKSDGDTWVFDAERDSIVLSTTEKNRLTAGTQGIDLEDGFTWSLWVKASSSNLTDSGADTIIGTRSGWHKIDVSQGTSNWTGISLPATLADDTWHHIGYVGDMTDVSLYIDGVFVGKDTTPASTTFNGALQFGGNDSWNEDITGLMSDVAIWDERLSEARIQAIAAGASVYSNVDAGDDMVSWSGQPTALNPGYADGYTPASWQWTANAPEGFIVEFDPGDNVEAPTVTITKDADTGNADVVELILTADDGNGPESGSMTIDVYDNSCQAAKGVGMVTLDDTDINEDCVTDIKDFAVLALDWLKVYEITEPRPKPSTE